MRLWLAMFLTLAAWAQPADVSPRPRYEVKRAGSPIMIDGKLDDAAWKVAPWVEFGFPSDWDFQTGEKQKTSAKFLWDEQNLYVGYECEDTDINAHYTHRDDPVYQDDVVEIYINPKPSQDAAYIGLEMNAAAVLYDYINVRRAGILKQFDMQGVRLASHLRGTLNQGGARDEGWSLEVAIPWGSFQGLGRRPEPGAAWTANLNRWDGVGATQKERRLSTWAHPNRFGDLRFVE